MLMPRLLRPQGPTLLSPRCLPATKAAAAVRRLAPLTLAVRSASSTSSSSSARGAASSARGASTPPSSAFRHGGLEARFFSSSGPKQLYNYSPYQPPPGQVTPPPPQGPHPLLQQQQPQNNGGGGASRWWMPRRSTVVFIALGGGLCYSMATSEWATEFVRSMTTRVLERKAERRIAESGEADDWYKEDTRAMVDQGDGEGPVPLQLAGGLMDGPLSKVVKIHTVLRNRRTGGSIAFVSVGKGLMGFPLTVHGGASATILEEFLARCAHHELLGGVVATPDERVYLHELRVDYKKRIEVVDGYEVICQRESSNNLPAEMRGKAGTYSGRIVDKNNEVCVTATAVYKRHSVKFGKDVGWGNERQQQQQQQQVEEEPER